MDIEKLEINIKNIQESRGNFTGFILDKHYLDVDFLDPHPVITWKKFEPQSLLYLGTRVETHTGGNFDGYNLLGQANYGAVSLRLCDVAAVNNFIGGLVTVVYAGTTIFNGEIYNIEYENKENYIIAKLLLTAGREIVNEKSQIYPVAADGDTKISDYAKELNTRAGIKVETTTEVSNFPYYFPTISGNFTHAAVLDAIAARYGLHWNITGPRTVNISYAHPYKGKEFIIIPTGFTPRQSSGSAVTCDRKKIVYENRNQPIKSVTLTDANDIITQTVETPNQDTQGAKELKMRLPIAPIVTNRKLTDSPIWSKLFNHYLSGTAFPLIKTVKIDNLIPLEIGETIAIEDASSVYYLQTGKLHYTITPHASKTTIEFYKERII